MASRKAREDERKGMEKVERRHRKDVRDERRGMEKHWDEHRRMPRDHYKKDDEHLESQKVYCDRQEGIDRVLQKKGDMRKGQGGKMHAGGDEKNWRRGEDKLTPRSA